MNPPPLDFESGPSPDVLRSLGRVVKGLSALFWGLPLALLASAQTDPLTWLKPQTAILPVLAHGLLLYGILQLGAFQPRERVWTRALESAKILALVNVGLAPFLHFWNAAPEQTHFARAVTVMIFTGLALLYSLNGVIARLTAMLPDPTLRDDGAAFTKLNRQLLAIVFVVLIFFLTLDARQPPPGVWLNIVLFIDRARNALAVGLLLFPMAMTLALLWKTKEAIFHGAFSPEGRSSRA